MVKNLPVQGTWVQSLVGEDSTCHWATKLTRIPTEARAPTAHAPQEKRPQGEAQAPQPPLAAAGGVRAQR